MRVKRVEKFRRLRKKKMKKVIMYAFVLPATSIFLGYVIRSLFILPFMTANR
ncbi:UNVERIFIED_CONTAM: hypothetical protein Cloal_2419 [Acetivibrio alkalicellulosi]